jgi:hypothetical protein
VAKSPVDAFPLANSPDEKWEAGNAALVMARQSFVNLRLLIGIIFSSPHPEPETGKCRLRPRRPMLTKGLQGRSRSYPNGIVVTGDRGVNDATVYNGVSSKSLQMAFGSLKY